MPSIFKEFLFSFSSNREDTLILNGYDYLHRSHKIGDIPKLCDILFNTKYNFRHSLSFSRVLANVFPSDDLLINQHFARKHYLLFKAIIKSFASKTPVITTPVPPQWRFELRKFGIRYTPLSTSIWFFYLMKMLSLSIQRLFFHIFNIKISLATLPVNHQSIFFCDILESCIPDISSNDSSYSSTIVDWYLSQTNINKPIISHSLDISSFTYKGSMINPYSTCFPDYSSYLELLSFFLSSCREILLSAISLLFGGWHTIILLQDKIDALRFFHAPISQVHREYWLHNSNLYPPLWCYLLPSRNSSCHYYFYSDPFVGISSRYFNSYNAYSLSNWPTVHCWTRDQSNVISSLMPSASVVPSPDSFIPFSDAPFIYSKGDSRHHLALFDITPFEDLTWKTFCLNHGYLRSDFCIKFLNDVLCVAAELDIQVIFKNKRPYDYRISKSYQSFLSRALSSYDIIVVPPAVSPVKVINYASASVSMPYTSTALIANALGKASCYYDPYGIDHNLTSYSSVPTINSVECLRCFLKTKLHLL
jgi:polysaccharide biosynthesis PFTS motif protein